MLTIDQRKTIDAMHLAIQQAYVRRGKPNPIKYEAWSCPVNSKMYAMRCQKGCPECGGNGYRWIDEGGTTFGWVRCSTGSRKFVTATEAK